MVLLTGSCGICKLRYQILFILCICTSLQASTLGSTNGEFMWITNDLPTMAENPHRASVSAAIKSCVAV